MSLTDSDLVASVLASEDHGAFAELVRRHQSPVRAFLTRMTRGDSHLADDLAQETFLKAWKKLNTFRGDARLSTWLLGIAFNEVRDEARRRKGYLREDLDGSETERAERSAVPNSNLRIDLEEALKSLNLNERAAVLLCCQNGLSHSEAAGVLNCPIGTLKTNVLRGKEKLKRQLSHMNSSQEIDPIDELFREHETHVEDRGFTARVMKELPRQHRAWLSSALLLGAAAIGSVLAVFWVPWGNLPAFDSSDLLSPNSHVLLPWTFALAVAGSLIWSAITAVLRL